MIITTRGKPKDTNTHSSGGCQYRTVLVDIDVQDNKCGDKLIQQLQSITMDKAACSKASSAPASSSDGLHPLKIDILINNAGYFYGPQESILKGTLNMEEELKMIDICALGPLRITAALQQANMFAEKDAKVVMITSQGGSIDWRFTQNPHGGDYGHHMSKAAANMMGVLVSQELKENGIMVGILHPGFNKTGTSTACVAVSACKRIRPHVCIFVNICPSSMLVHVDMTSKYAKIWDIEGAVDAAEGAKRTIHEIGQIGTHIAALSSPAIKPTTNRAADATTTTTTSITTHPAAAAGAGNGSCHHRCAHGNNAHRRHGSNNHHASEVNGGEVASGAAAAGDGDGWKRYYASDTGQPYYYHSGSQQWHWATGDKGCCPATTTTTTTTTTVPNPARSIENNAAVAGIDNDMPLVVGKGEGTNCVFINCEDGKVIPW